MPSHEISTTDTGGIKIIVIDNNDTERSVVLEPDDNGNITIEGIGPNGKKRGEVDPSGNGNNPLGK